MRRYAQFSIRSLLILMLAVACWCGGWQAATWKAERDKREALRQAREEARKAQVEAEAAAAQRPTVVALPIQTKLAQPVSPTLGPFQSIPSPPTVLIGPLEGGGKPLVVEPRLVDLTPTQPDPAGDQPERQPAEPKPPQAPSP